MPLWLILFHRIPPKPLYLRAQVRKRLADVGAIAVKNAVYLLPHGADQREDLEWIAEEITAQGGDAHLLAGDFVDGTANDAVVAQFKEARNPEYEAIAAAAINAPASQLASVHARLLRRFETVRRLDFFEADGRKSAEASLGALGKRLHKSSKEQTRMEKTNPGLRGKTWVTRPGVNIDRMASAWFIRRFIDPKARFQFVDPASPRAEGQLRYDMVGGDFTHEADRCTLETLVGRVGLPDQGVRAIAEIVHDLDLKDSKFDRAEVPGVRMMMEGLMARSSDDDDRLERARVIFDDLHEALGGSKRGGRAQLKR